MKPKSKENTNLEKIFQRELSIAEKAESFLTTKDFSLEELLENFASLTSEYRNLLKQGMKITRIGDVTQNRLIKIQEQLDKQNEELEKKNTELIAKNEELVRSKEALVESYEKADQIFSALSDVLAGTVLDEKYQLEEKLGAGGFGVVYKAKQLTLNRPVAIKVFRPSSGNKTFQALERFLLEGVSSCRINHINAITIFDSAISSTGIAYLVMELLKGHSLTDELRESRFITPMRCGQIIAPVCSALEVAHNAGVVHRDIKPDNIFLHQTSKGEIVKVLDFGIAKLIGEELTSENVTTYGHIVGTPIYMSPERLSSLPYDGKSDVYSLGIMIYKMLCGCLPFEGEGRDIWSVINMHLLQKPQPMKDMNPKVSPELEAVVFQALEKNPKNRPTAKELAQKFMAALDNSSEEDTIDIMMPRIINSIN